MGRHLNRLWVFLYTAGLTDPQKACRREEIECDLYEQFQFCRRRGDRAAAIERSIASRMVRGIVADILWRMEAGRDGERIAFGANPPLPWFTMWYVTALIVAGSVSSTQVDVIGDYRALSIILAAFGAGLLWFGLHLATRQFLGPLFITGGTLVTVACLWWTLIVPLLAVAAGISSLHRAHRIDVLLTT